MGSTSKPRATSYGLTVSRQRRDHGEMTELAEGARLEIVCPVKSGTEGSNPSLSARKHLPDRTQIDADFQDSEEIKPESARNEPGLFLRFFDLRASA